MQRHQRGGAGAVDGEGRPREIKGEGDPIGGDAHGRPRGAVMVNGVGVVVDDGLVVPIHKPCNNIVYIHTAPISIWVTLHPPLTPKVHVSQYIGFAANLYRRRSCFRGRTPGAFQSLLRP